MMSVISAQSTARKSRPRCRRAGPGEGDRQDGATATIPGPSRHGAAHPDDRLATDAVGDPRRGDDRDDGPERDQPTSGMSRAGVRLAEAHGRAGRTASWVRTAPAIRMASRERDQPQEAALPEDVGAPGLGGDGPP